MRIKTKDKHISKILKNTYENAKEEIVLSAILNRVYLEKMSNEIINTKVNNQLNAMEISIYRINPKFTEKKSKNYDKIKEEMQKILADYEEVLKKFCKIYDQKIEQIILKKVELETKLLMATIVKQDLYQKELVKSKHVKALKGLTTVVDTIKGKMKKTKSTDTNLTNQAKNREEQMSKEFYESEEYQENKKYILKLEKEIKNLNKKITDLNDEKKEKVWKAMESENVAISKEIKKPRTLKKLTRFFVNRFNTFNTIMKTMIDPINQRIAEFKLSELENIDKKSKDFDLTKTQEQIINIQNNILEDIKNKLICQRIGILDN